MSWFTHTQGFDNLPIAQKRTWRLFGAVLHLLGIMKKENPKRMQREAQKAMQNTGIGTKAQQDLKLQQEQGKLARKERSKQQREAEEQCQFDLRQEKRKEKHRGH